MHKGEAESEEESPQLKGVEASLKSETQSQEKKKKALKTKSKQTNKKPAKGWAVCVSL